MNDLCMHLNLGIQMQNQEEVRNDKIRVEISDIETEKKNDERLTKLKASVYKDKHNRQTFRQSKTGKIKLNKIRNGKEITVSTQIQRIIGKYMKKCMPTFFKFIYFSEVTQVIYFIYFLCTSLGTDWHLPPLPSLPPTHQLLLPLLLGFPLLIFIMIFFQYT